MAADGRDFVVVLNQLTTINQQGENLLLELLNDGVIFRSHEVFAEHVLRQLARTRRGNLQEQKT